MPRPRAPSAVRTRLRRRPGAGPAGSGRGPGRHLASRSQARAGCVFSALPAAAADPAARRPPDSDAWPVSAPPGTDDREKLRAWRPRRLLPGVDECPEARRAEGPPGEGKAPPWSPDGPCGPLGPGAHGPPGRGGGGGGDFIAVTREFLTGRAGAELGVPHLGAWAADRPGWASGAGGGAAVSRASGAISGWPFPGGSPPPGTPGKAARSSALRPRAGRAGGACAWKQPSQDPGPRDSPRSAGAGGLHFFFFPGGSYCRLVGEGVGV